MGSDVPFLVLTDNKIDEIHRGKTLNPDLVILNLIHFLLYHTMFEELSSQTSAIL